MRARAAASWGRVGPRDATASARATRNPAYAGPGFGAAPSARLAPSRLAGGAFCGHQDHLGQVQSPWRSREAIKKYFVWTALSRTVVPFSKYTAKVPYTKTKFSLSCGPY